MIKAILVLGLIINYGLKLRHNVLNRIKSGKKDFIFSLAEFLIPALAIIQLFYFPFKHTMVNYLGLFIFVGGIILSTFARLQLKENYMPAYAARRPRKIITSGAYKIVRHPIYLGTILAISGFELALQPMVAFLVVIAIPVLAYQIKKEERLLEKYNKKEWKKYVSKTSFKLIPFIY